MGQERHDSSVRAGNQEHSDVTTDPVREQGEQEITSPDESQSTKCMADTFLGIIRVHCVADDDDKSEHVRGHCEQLRSISGETQVCYDRRREVAERVQGIDHEEIGSGVQPEYRVQQCLFRNLNIEGLVFFVRRKWSHASDSKYTLLFGQELCVTGIVGHEDPDNDSKEDSRDTCQDE